MTRTDYVKVTSLLTILLILRPINASSSIETLDTQAGYQAINLGETPIIEYYTNILHVIDIKHFNETLSKINYNVESTFSLPDDEIIIKRLETHINRIRHNLETLVPHRFKRGLINIGGSLFRWLFGTMDSEDRVSIEEHLKSIDLNSHNTISNVNKQIKINNDLQNNLNILENKINENRKLINQLIRNPNSLLQRSIKELIFLSLLSDLQLLESEIDKIQENIMSSKHNLMSRSILTVEEIETYDIDISKFKEIKCSLLKMSDKLIFILSIPNQTKIAASKYKLISIPNKSKEEIIIPNENILLFENQVYIDNKIRYIKQLKEADKCSKSLMKKKYEYCTKQIINNYQIIEVTPNILLIKNAKNSELIDCNNKSHILNNNYIVRFSNCTLYMNNVKFSNKENIIDNNIIIPNYSKPDNVTLLLNLNDIHLKQIENIEKINEIKTHSTSSSILSYTTITIIVTVIIVYTIFQNLNKIKNVKIKVLNRENKSETNPEDLNLNEGGIIYPQLPVNSFSR